MLQQSSEKDVGLIPKRFADFNNTLKLYCHVFGSESSLRHYVFFSEQNGLSESISRLGKKLIFDLDKLDQWLANGGMKCQ